MKIYFKSIALATFFLFTLSMESYAQTFGLRAGLNSSNLLVKDDDTNYGEELDFASTLGFNAGVTVEFPLSNLLSIESGFIFNTKGTHYEIDFFGETIKSSINLLYLDIPVTAKVAFPVGGSKIFAATEVHI